MKSVLGFGAIVFFLFSILGIVEFAARNPEVQKELKKDIQVIPVPVPMVIPVEDKTYFENKNKGPRDSEEWMMLRYMVGNEEAIRAYEVLCDETLALIKNPDMPMSDDATTAIKTIDRLVPKRKVPVYRDQFVKACVE